MLIFPSRLISYEPEGSKAILSGQQSSAQCHVSVQTTLVEPFQPTLGAQYFVHGEIEKTDGESEYDVYSNINKPSLQTAVSLHLGAFWLFF